MTRMAIPSNIALPVDSIIDFAYPSIRPTFHISLYKCAGSFDDNLIEQINGSLGWCNCWYCHSLSSSYIYYSVVLYSLYSLLYWKSHTTAFTARKRD